MENYSHEDLENLGMIMPGEYTKDKNGLIIYYNDNEL